MMMLNDNSTKQSAASQKKEQSQPNSRPPFKEQVEKIMKKGLENLKAAQERAMTKKIKSEDYQTKRNEAAKKAVEEMLNQPYSSQQAMADLARLREQRLKLKQ